MVRIAGERIADLFAEAEGAARSPQPWLADRYVRLARSVGMRHNVRLVPEQRELYCRRCSAYWVEGRTVRTRLRGGHRVRTCLACGSARRTLLRAGPGPAALPPSGSGEPPLGETAAVGAEPGEPGGDDDSGEDG